jgi:hypothetical protein
MIDTKTETVISFAEASKLTPGRPHLSQIYRWSQAGLRGIKLDWIQVGGRRFTSREALDRFFAALTGAAGGEATIPPSQARQRAVMRARGELEGAGFEVGASGV